MPGDQSFCLTVPNANCTISAGAGAVDGFTMTTDANAFQHAAINSIIEAGADARVVAGAVFGAVAGTGVLIGTPCTIQASAGGGIQIYAGAGISPDLGGPTGPGEAFGPSEPAAFEAGERAESLNKLNDGIKAVSDVVGAGMDAAEAETAFEAFKAGYDMAKGGWEAAQALGAPEVSFGESDLAMSGVGMFVAAAGGDTTDFVTAAADFVGKGMGAASKANPARGGAGLGNTTAATGPTSVAGAAGGALGAPGDGPRIHEVAPANIDRKCGADMTALVAGKKETKVDGKIEYTSGASITMKAFTKVETQSLFFEAHANVTAVMKGLAQAKVESMGKVLVEGKAKFKVATMGSGTIDATGKLDVKTKGKMTLDAGGVLAMKAGGAATLHAANVGVVGKSKVALKAPNIELNGATKISKTLEVQGTTKLKKPVLICSHTKIQKTLKVGDSCKFG
jgi:hypothetical protein